MGSLTTRLSSKGQVVIPVQARRALGWRSGQTLSVQLAPSPAPGRLVLRPRAAADVEAVLERGYVWLAERGVDPVEVLHAARRRARARERQFRRP